ncbi:hypothetical protein FUAX_40210 (plasmid) [Fulvitalea axinellae]|uniref:Uncharacterized protein n=1 Tax=Fulvitalea axinellae TaxID=1182444 RepID=A0AAU9CYK7_9BACT|nr:hypothetical protein FUAX_40210 [Fulvitalea axinellae]
MVIRKKGNAIPLSVEQMRKAPCLEVITREYEEKLYGIECRPQNGVDDEAIANVHIEALREKYEIDKWEILRK